MENRVFVDKKYLLIDLDGTLIDTANNALKPMKDGQIETDLSQIKLFPGVTEFLSEARSIGFEYVILSDSHPKYVNRIVEEYFGNTAALSLADKPNTLKSLSFLYNQGIDISGSICYIIGDSWLDIELGRGLQVPTVLTEFYEAINLEIRDGIGNYVKNVKSGSTYYAKNYSDILNILKSPLENLLCLEAEFKGINSYKARKPRLDLWENDGQLTAHRVLARQSQGECDKYHATEKYFEFSQEHRSQELLYTIRNAVMAYINCVLKYNHYSWDIFTYVPDKVTTQPSNKMGELFALITEQVRQKTLNLNCLNTFEWNDEICSSTRKQPTADHRRDFVRQNLTLCDGIDIREKSLIILDDQYTTGATADAVIEKLRNKGADNILFIALFHLITPVNNSRFCPECLTNGVNKQLQLKINRQTGEKFYSCVSPQYKGYGCGYSDSGRLCPICLKKEENRYLKVKTNSKTGEKFYSCVSPQYRGYGCGYTSNIE